FLLGIFGTWLFAAVDAVRTAQLIRAGFAPDAEQDAIARRLYGNPLAWAVTMITLGTVFLLHTLFNVQLPVREFLPVVLVLLGGGRTGSLPGEVTRFGTGELATQVSARQPSGVWPTEPRV